LICALERANIHPLWDPCQRITQQGLKNVIFLAPNYVGGHDAATGFKRDFKGKLQEHLRGEIRKVKGKIEDKEALRAAQDDRHGPAKPCRRLCAGLQDEIAYLLPSPALAHCSSWSPVTPLTPTPPITLPSAMIGRPPGEANTPGSVAVAGPPLLITSAKARVGRR
jgi:hypothetical protein